VSHRNTAYALGIVCTNCMTAAELTTPRDS
jgi:hypothetical protein